MGSFTYRPALALSGADRFRHFLNFASPHKIHFYARLIPAGFVGPNTQSSVNGIGLGNTPKALLMFCNGTNYDVTDGVALSVGASSGPGERWTSSIWCPFGDTSARQSLHDTTKLINMPVVNNPSAVGITADLLSFGTNSFTLDVTCDTGDDQRIMGLAIWHPSATYKVGTALTPAGAGTQSITGLGFRPRSIWLCSTQLTALGRAPHSRLAMGCADDTNGQFCCWTGAGSGDPYIDSAAASGYCLTMWLDSDAAGPFTVTQLAQAQLVSFDPDGFTLNWTGDGTQRYWSWFAAGADSEADRFTFNHTTVVDTTVPARGLPKGLWFFQNDIGDEGLTRAITGGQSFGVGAASSNDAGSWSGAQNVAATEANDAHTFPFADINTRQIDISTAFGCIARWADSVVAADPEDYGQIVSSSGTDVPPPDTGWKPHIYRRDYL